MGRRRRAGRLAGSVLLAAVASLAGGAAAEDYVLYDDFSWPGPALDRSKWWRGGVDGVDGANAILNESDLTSTMMFVEGDFKFVIGGPSASPQGLFGLGDIDDGDPYLVLADAGSGWRLHVRNGATTYTGPVIAPSLARGDVVVLHWDSAGSRVSINGAVKDSQTLVHPPRMPITMLEWTGTATRPDKARGRIVMDSVSYSCPPSRGPEPAPTNSIPPGDRRVLSARLVEDTFVDRSAPGTNFHRSAHPVGIRNCRHHPDLTGAGRTVDAGHLGLVQFDLPPLPAGWTVAAARLSGVVAQNHRMYGRPGWAPGRPIELEVLGLRVNPDLATVTCDALLDATGAGVIAGYSAAGSVNFTFGSQARSLEVLRFDTSVTPEGCLLQFPDRGGRLCGFVRGIMGRGGSNTVTLALGPGRTQAVSGMDCDFQFHSRENTAGRAPMSLVLELERIGPASAAGGGEQPPRRLERGSFPPDGRD